MTTQLAAIILKELREALRTTRGYVVVTFIYSAFLQWFIIRSYLSMQAAPGGNGAGGDAHAPLSTAAGFSLIYVAPMVLPFFANAILSRSFIEERVRQALLPILCTGVRTSTVWIGKLLAAFAFSYVVVLICIVIDLVLMRAYFGIPVPASPAVWVTALVVTPIVSLGILAVMSLMFWTVRHANMVASFFPVVLSLGIWAYVSAHPTTGVLAAVLVVAFAGAAVMIGASAWVISRLSRQFVVGL